jgi:hypothetical protein
MTTTTGPHARPWLTTLNLVLAGTAVALGVIAIVSDDAGSTSQQPSPAAVAPANASGVDDANQHAELNVSPIGQPGRPIDDCQNGPAHGPPAAC